MKNFSKKPLNTDVNQCRMIKTMRNLINLSSKGIVALFKNQNPQRDSRKKRKSLRVLVIKKTKILFWTVSKQIQWKDLESTIS
jgi:hypothetical protein